jgi:L-alanine-DL-glutamate epimerase-like enolase superfamily enzyme
MGTPVHAVVKQATDMTITDMTITDMTITDTALYFLPVRCERLLGFGGAAVESVVCARVAVTVSSSDGKSATGWGEVPLNVHWAWPAGGAGVPGTPGTPGTPGAADAAGDDREQRMMSYCVELAKSLKVFSGKGHPLDISLRFMQEMGIPVGGVAVASLPPLAAVVCMAPFDLALYDAYGRLHNVGAFDVLTERWMNHDLGYYFGGDEVFRGRYPGEWLNKHPVTRLGVWHLVGYLDPLQAADGGGSGEVSSRRMPASLQEWIRRDGLQYLKIKLGGTDLSADCGRIGEIVDLVAADGGFGSNGIRALSVDFNGVPGDAGYVHDFFDWMERSYPNAYEHLLYVEEPLTSALVHDRRAVTSLARRKPLFMDESAVWWTDVVRGRESGWSGVALKTCKTLSGALLSLCRAEEFGLPVMVQDLTNPMLAQLTHLAFASRVRTLYGVESNAMQFYPRASDPEAAVHPGAYCRREGTLDISTLRGAGFGYRLEEMKRDLPGRAA